jgi:protocatechuate 3,4-dioxygenase beta subunit
MTQVTRRAFLWMLLGAPTALALSACSQLEQAMEGVQQTQSAPATSPAAVALLPTPACGDDDDPTPPQGAGPFYTPNSPLRDSLIEADTVGTRLMILGSVVTTACQPIAGAMLDWWHADDSGQYDNVGYRFRGHQFADEQGRFQLETIVPGLYPGRTRHLHVRVQAPNQAPLTTQVYFPDVPENDGDFLFDPALIMDTTDQPDGGRRSAFTFVLSV